jgi:hypothetical protein
MSMLTGDDREGFRHHREQGAQLLVRSCAPENRGPIVGMMLQVRLDDRQIKGAFAQCLQIMDGSIRAYGTATQTVVVMGLFDEAANR